MKRVILFGLLLLLTVSAASLSGCANAIRATERANVDTKESDSLSILPQQVLNVVFNGGGSGVVGTKVHGVGRGCVESCSISVDTGEKVYLAALPENGSRFRGWSGCDSVDGIACEITTSADKTVTVTFARAD
jgi:hypothetical protein